MRWIIQKVFERLTSLFAASFAARVESMLILEHTEHLDHLEERARRLESEGKAELAASLRALSGKISLENPGSSIAAALQNLLADESLSTTPPIQEAPEQGKARPTRALPRKGSEPNSIS